ncbi:MAG: Crp/Fnr family transcriptional regulator [Eubacteriales bacterium]|nr:Crp/Fnr family transcriptional regulator [Eubacteriales bacterium]
MLSPRYYFTNDFTPFEKAIEERSKSHQKHAKGVILSQLEMSDAYYVKSGVLKWCIVNEDGNAQTILFAGTGSIIPLQLSTEKFTLENVLFLEAMTDVELLVISPEQMQALTLEDQSMVTAVAAYYNKICNILLSRIYLHSFNCSVRLVASVIYVLDSDISIRKFYPQITQEDLISLTGISRAQTARALKQLREEQIIETGRQSILVRDKRRLMELCSFAPAQK